MRPDRTCRTPRPHRWKNPIANQPGADVGGLEQVVQLENPPSASNPTNRQSVALAGNRSIRAAICAEGESCARAGGAFGDMGEQPQQGHGHHSQRPAPTASELRRAVNAFVSGAGAPSIAHGAGAIRNLHPQHQQPEGDPPALTTNVPSEELLSLGARRHGLARDERACLGASVLQARAGRAAEVGVRMPGHMVQQAAAHSALLAAAPVLACADT